MFQYNSADDLFGNKEEISVRQITIKLQILVVIWLKEKLKQ